MKINVGKAIDILMVEDNPDDVTLTTEALKETKIAVNLNVVENGIQAMQYLKKEDKYIDAVRPDLILLDLNLPKMDGREVLSELKSSKSIRNIPVVVLTTSMAEEDIAQAYELQANCYITKPIDLNQFEKVVRSIEEFWFTIVKLPPKND
ncbi:MAG: response regulator [candidate division Zixibacteria bacterium]|nr:response regulator [candidate division Zixibacteria bacterium]